MPVSYTVDSKLRRIVARAAGAVGEQDLIAYQKEIGSRPDLVGYDEILDATQTDSLLDINFSGLKRVADLAASMDAAGKPPRLAIVANRDMIYGLGRMYEAFRETAAHTNKQVAVFHSRQEAEAWLASPPDD